MNVLDEEPDVQAKNLVRLALYTGMRRGELFSLKWGDVDFERKVINIKSGTSNKFAKIPLNEMAEMAIDLLGDYTNDFAPSYKRLADFRELLDKEFNVKPGTNQKDYPADLKKIELQ